MSKVYTSLFVSAFALFCVQVKSFGQGCVAIRSNGNTCSMGNPATAKGWQLSFNTRYFRSYKHFVGTIEQKQRVENQTQVINHSFSEDIILTRTLNTRWSLSMDVPVISNVRSSLYEHGGSARHETRSFGMGDIRFTAYRWLFDPAKAHKGNIQAGLGIKFATGDYQYQDFFYKTDGTQVPGPVDQSIQLGDGGTGFSTELNGYYNLSYKWGVYGNAFYLFNPRDQNGVSTARGGVPSTSSIQYFTSTMSVPDQYMVRAGASFMAHQFTFSGGIRMEGVPSEDIIGGSKGFRRPGYVISAEPVVAYHAKKVNLFFSVPVALQRNRTQSFSDKLRTAATGTKVQGDAAFADYLVNAGFSVHF